VLGERDGKSDGLGSFTHHDQRNMFGNPRGGIDEVAPDAYESTRVATRLPGQSSESVNIAQGRAVRLQG
jgi:hypothetical protein